MARLPRATAPPIATQGRPSRRGPPPPPPPPDGEIERAARHSCVVTIQGGTTEIAR
ncbi:hypothetical protein I6A84_24360, partial [Frankia sp. CNm7]|nr:hypothetical protein [Frankia nepalensis]